MNQKFLSKVFVWGFLLLYLLVACISFCHAIEFFNIGNVTWMSITLAFAFEVGLALSLTAILLSEDNKKNTVPWILMCVLCLVQVIGNVYSVFKYISLSDTSFYVYLQKSLLFWIQGISQDTVMVIVSWIMGAILPIVALMMTEMVASNIRNSNKSTNQIVEEKPLEVKETIVTKKNEDRVDTPKPNKEEIGQRQTKTDRVSSESTVETVSEKTSGDPTVSVEDSEESKQEEPETEESDDEEEGGIVEDAPVVAGSSELSNDASVVDRQKDDLSEYIDILDAPAKAAAVRGRVNPNGNTQRVTPSFIKNFERRGAKANKN